MECQTAFIPNFQFPIPNYFTASSRTAFPAPRHIVAVAAAGTVSGAAGGSTPGRGLA